MSQKKSALSPKILKVKWGRMEVETLGRGKDFILWPGGGRSWDWRETGTRHSPGIQIGDCEELLNKGCQVVVLSRGMLLRLKVPPQSIEYLEQNGVEVVVAETKKAAAAYNSLIDEGKAVGGFFHSTC